MNTDLKSRILADLFASQAVLSRADVEARYPSRSLPEGAEVTRFCPSPTGFVHIGGIFMAMICQYVARQSGGVYMLRIEDTDKKREVEGARELIARQQHAFGLDPDEGLQADGTVKGAYGPYLQSERKELYYAFVADLLERGRAYPCFATAEELEAAVKDQQAKKQRPGYYGEWALWRDRPDEEVAAALDAGKPYVLRFKSQGSHDKRVVFDDVVKGRMELPENDLDVPLLKSDESRLPTYHLAHVVDDYLMKATLVLRGEEWLPSTPLHLELADALGIPRHRYAHSPVISILDANGGGKRKLSKRKDPEADVAFWLKSAYPLRAVKAYLLGLANSNFEEWYKANPASPLEDYPFSLPKLASSRSPLLDMKKVEDYAKDEIAALPQEHFDKEILAWTQVHDHELYESMVADPNYTKAVLAIERGGEKPRKDVAKWSDAPEQFGYFYDGIFASRFKNAADAELAASFNQELISQACTSFMNTFDSTLQQTEWFERLKAVAESCGFATDNKTFKQNPDAFKGNVADFARIIRMKLTGKNRTPDLWTIMQVMGEQRITSRLK